MSKEENEEKIEKYLKEFVKISNEQYLELEELRFRYNKYIKKVNWVNLIRDQEFECFYCKTNLKIIQELIIERKINPRKRGSKGGYSGMHFELDHKDSNLENNSDENLVASCYYCNNDKSNTISSDIFRKYFGPKRRKAFLELFKKNKLTESDCLRHRLCNK